MTPIKTLDRTDVKYEFVLPSTPQGLIDMNGVLLYVKGRLVRVLENNETTPLAAKEKCNMVNNTLHSLFKTITLQIGKNQVSV